MFRSDPVLNSDETGRFFYLSLLESFCDDIWRSTNGGQAWTRLPPEGGAGGGDKQWFTVDKTNGMGHGFQYQAWSTAAPCSFGQFSRSTDGGFTWQSPLSIPNSPVWGTLDVATNGNLFIGGASNFSSPFWCIRSSNAQNPNVTPTFDQITQVNLGGSLVFGGAINPGGLAGQLFLAVDRSGGPTNNNIYMLASVQTGGNGTDVMFARSTNGGASFSAPQRINDDPVNPNKWHWFGTLSVAPNGRIDAVWFDTRNAANNTDSQLFYSFSTDAGVTWAPNVAVSNPFNPFEGYPNQNKIGDYITIVSDATGGNVAYAATFNFNPGRTNTRKTFITSVYLLQELRHRRLHPHRHLRPQRQLPRRQQLRLPRHRGRSYSLRAATRCRGSRGWTSPGMELPRTTSTSTVTACWLPLCRTSPGSTPITSVRVARARTPTGSAMQALNTALTRSR